MIVTLGKDVRIEGSDEYVLDILKKLNLQSLLNPSEYYKSETKGYIRIKDMNTTHLKNAILKQYGIWLEGLRSISNPQRLAKTIADGIDDPCFKAMLREYYIRPEE